MFFLFLVLHLFLYTCLANTHPETPPIKRQDASQYGSVFVWPSNITMGETINIFFDSTQAENQPFFVDFYLVGLRRNNINNANVLIKRNSYESDQSFLYTDYKIPDLRSFGAPLTWSVWAYITYNYDDVPGLDLYAGNSFPIYIQGSSEWWEPSD